MARTKQTARRERSPILIVKPDGERLVFPSETAKRQAVGNITMSLSRTESRATSAGRRVDTLDIAMGTFQQAFQDPENFEFALDWFERLESNRAEAASEYIALQREVLTLRKEREAALEGLVEFEPEVVSPSRDAPKTSPASPAASDYSDYE